VAKIIDFELDIETFNSFFRIIRKKEDVILLLMDIVKFIQISHVLPKGISVGKLRIVVSKMNRVFLLSGDKHYSIAFPFSVELLGGEQYMVSSNICGEVDSVISSQIKAIFKNNELLNCGCVSKLADTVLDKSEIIPSFWPLVRELILFEDGYIRYDFDTDRENGDLHPLNHLDIFYSSRASFKLGLPNKLTEDDLSNILNTETDCQFIR
jgi:hypothetical protein